MAFSFAEADLAAQIFGVRQAVQGHATDAGGRGARGSEYGARRSRDAGLGADIAGDASGVAHDDRIRRDVAGHDSRRPDHRPFADGDAGQDGGVSADGGAGFHRGAPNALLMMLAAGKRIVREGDIGADKDVIAECDAVPQLDARFDDDAIADDDIAFNEDVVADIAVGPDAGTGENVDKRPDAGTGPDIGGFNDGGGMLGHGPKERGDFLSIGCRCRGQRCPQPRRTVFQPAASRAPRPPSCKRRGRPDSALALPTSGLATNPPKRRSFCLGRGSGKAVSGRQYPAKAARRR